MPLFLAACKLIRDAGMLMGWGETARDDKNVAKALEKSETFKALRVLCAALAEELQEAEGSEPVGDDGPGDDS